MKPINKTTWGIILIGVCAMIAILIIFGVSRSAHAADQEPELYRVRLDCFYKMSPDAPSDLEQPVMAGAIIVVTGRAEIKLSKTMTLPALICSTPDGERFLYAGFAEPVPVEEYIPDKTISAYYPGECGWMNHKGQQLVDLVGDIVAVPSGSPYFGKQLVIVTPSGKVLQRRVWDTGCMRGRLDMLVSDAAAMNTWGLPDCQVWVLEEEE